MKKVFICAMMAVILICFLSIILFSCLHQRRTVPDINEHECLTFDATPLYTKLSECDMVKIVKANRKKGNEILYESRDLEEVKLVIDSIIVNTNGYRIKSLKTPWYYLSFCRNGDVVVLLEVRTSTLRWNQGSWDWKEYDFLLTGESYHKFVSWFCDATGEPALEYPVYPSLRNE